jgi:hypothetical protein
MYEALVKISCFVINSTTTSIDCPITTISINKPYYKQKYNFNNNRIDYFKSLTIPSNRLSSLIDPQQPINPDINKNIAIAIMI